MAPDVSPTTEAIKGTMLQARVAWVREHLDHAAQERLRAALQPPDRTYLDRPPLATDWIPLDRLLSLDIAIASVAGGPAEDVYRALGHHSATMNLRGVYKAFAVEEPHRFFEQQALLHRRFQNFGTAHYERGGLQSGRLRIEGYAHPTPVFCASGRGYFEGALEMMKVPGPIQCTEVLCQCSGDPSCLFDLSW
jgi:uncharacterized protein (TIGR02265 family)